MNIASINSQRDAVAGTQRAGPDGLMYPILSLCCYYASSARVHKACTAKLCVCPCHELSGLEMTSALTNPPPYANDAPTGQQS